MNTQPGSFTENIFARMAARGQELCRPIDPKYTANVYKCIVKCRDELLVMAIGSSSAWMTEVLDPNFSISRLGQDEHRNFPTFAALFDHIAYLNRKQPSVKHLNYALDIPWNCRPRLKFWLHLDDCWRRVAIADLKAMQISAKL